MDISRNRFKIAFFKPRKDGKGSSVTLNYNPDSNAVYLTMMPQSPNLPNGKEFDYSQRSVYKLGTTDISQLLSVICGDVDGAGRFNDKENVWSGIYHSTGTDNSATLYFYRYKNNNVDGYILTLSTTRGKKSSKYSMSISLSEARHMQVLLSHCLLCMSIDQPLITDTLPDNVGVEEDEEIPV